MGALYLKSRNIALLVFDTLVSMLASAIVILFVRWLTEPISNFQRYVLVWTLLGGLFSVCGILLLGTNKIVIKHSTLRSIGELTKVVCIKGALLALCVVLGIFQFESKAIDVFMVATDMLLTITLLVLVRVMAVVLVSELRDSPERNINKLSVLVYGATDKSASMVIRLEKSEHYNVVGYLTRDKSRDGLVALDKTTYCFENIEDLRKLKSTIGVEGILFSDSADSDAEGGKDGLLTMCLQLGLQCMLSPKIDQMEFSYISRQAVKEVVNTSLDYIPDGMSAFERNTKRFVDFVLSSILLIIFSPVLLICAIALKLDDGGPAIYKQERIGRFGRPFMIYKFRSMKVDAEAAGPALYSGDDDPRLTRVGKFLRLHHLDEMPQLFNVWKGDMAFVGHRPERKFYIDQIMERDPRYYFLYQIRPGVTSYSTLHNGYTDTIEKMLRRLEFDLYYLRHRSWFFDIKVLWQTFINIVFGKVF